MGLSSSILANNDVHDHFASIVNPKKAAAAVNDVHEEKGHKFDELSLSRATCMQEVLRHCLFHHLSRRRRVELIAVGSRL